MDHSLQQNYNEFIDQDWLSHAEGQLSVDVSETNSEIIVRAAIAGISADDLDITLNDDTLTIRGSRSSHREEKTERVHVQECHWGTFSRSIILPAHVDPSEVDAVLKRGILTVRLQKTEVDTEVPVLDLDDV